MKSKKNIVLRLLLVASVFFGFVSAQAENKLYIEDFSVTSYDPVKVPVMLDSDGNIWTMSANLILPDNLEVVGAASWNNDRLQGVQGYQFNYNPKTEKYVIIIPPLGTTVPQGPGVLFYIPVKAKAGSLSGISTSKIRLEDIAMSNENVEPVAPVPNYWEATVTFNSLKVAYTLTPGSHVFNPGSNVIVTVAVDNDFDIENMSGFLTLPEGVTLVQNSFKPTARINQGSLSSSDIKKGSFIWFNTTSPVLNSGSGDMFSFELNVPADFKVEDLNVSVKFEVANTSLTTLPIPGVAETSLKNGFTAYNKALEEVNSLRAALQTALQNIQTQAPDVKDNFTGSDIENDINAFAQDIQTAYNDLSLTPDYDNVMQPAERIRQAISKLEADAKAAQQAYEDNKLAAENKAAYDQAIAVVTSLREQLLAALQTISTEAPDVKDNFTGNEISSKIDALQTEINAANQDKTIASRLSQILQPEAGIKSDIEKLVADAKAAQSAFEKAQLDKAHTDALAVVKSLNDKLTAALQTIAETAQDVKDQFKGENISSAISSLNDVIEAAYTDGSLTDKSEEILAPTADMEKDIEALVANAQKAQKDYEAAQLEAACKAAHDKANEALNALSLQHETALAAIAQNHPDVKDNFKGEDITKTISDTKNAVDAAYNDKTIADRYDEIMKGVEGVPAAITKLQEDAAAAQKAHDEAVAAEKARQEAYAEGKKMIDDLNTQLAAALETIAQDAPDVKDHFKGTDISLAINNLNTEIVGAFADKTIADKIEGYKSQGDLISKNIEKLVADAKDSQAAYEADKAAEEARQEAYKKANDEVKSLEEALAAALETISNEAADVKDNYKGENIATSIETLKSSIEAAYTDKTISDKLEEVLSPVAGINSDIEKLVSDAKASQAAYEADKAAEEARQEANKEAHDTDLETIESIQKQLEDAVEEIKTKYPSFDYVSRQEAIQAMIDAETQKANDAYKAVEEKGEYENTIEALSIETAIEQMIMEAQQSGIVLIFGEELEKDARIYNTQGTLLSEPVRGQINIIIRSDGTVQKVYVK